MKTNVKLVMCGVHRKGEKGFKTNTIFQAKTADPLPGTYNAQDFALSYPEYFAELVKAKMPALGDGQPVLITIG